MSGKYLRSYYSPYIRESLLPQRLDRLQGNGRQSVTVMIVGGGKGNKCIIYFFFPSNSLLLEMKFCYKINECTAPGNMRN